MSDYSALNPRTRANLDKAMKDNDPVLIRSIIVTAGEINLKNAEAAFRYASRNNDLFGIIEKYDPNLFEIKEKREWDNAYFTRHVQTMMRNFSEQAFRHYLEVGQFLFPERMQEAIEPTTRQETPQTVSLPPDERMVKKDGVTWVFKVGVALAIGFILLGLIIYFA
jgi:hypothetical protein